MTAKHTRTDVELKSLSDNDDRLPLRRASWILIAAAVLATATWLILQGWTWNGYWFDRAYRYAAATGLTAAAVMTLSALVRYVIRPDLTRRWDFVCATICFAILRLAMAGTFPLMVDEAYHWQWSHHLAWCYPDHPGMQAWLGYLPCLLFGDNLAGARLAPTLVGVAVIWCVYVLAWRLAEYQQHTAGTDGENAYGLPGWSQLNAHQIATSAATLAMITPLGWYLTMIISTDYPLALAWIITPLVLDWVLQSPPGTADDRQQPYSKSVTPWWYWAALGGCIGMGINAKFLAASLIAAVVLFLVLDWGIRRWLSARNTCIPWWGPAIAAGVAAICTLPVLVWNAENQWLTFVFNFAWRAEHESSQQANPWAFVGAQMMIISPVLFGTSIVVGIRTLRTIARQIAAGLYARLSLAVLVITLVPLCAYVAISAVRIAGVHWTLSLYSPLVALVVVQLWLLPPEGRSGPGGIRTWLARHLLDPRAVLVHATRVAAGMTMAVTVGIALLMVVTPGQFRWIIKHFRHDPERIERLSGEYQGWAAAADEIDALWQQYNARHDTFVMTMIYKDAAPLEFHTNTVKDVYVFDKDVMYGYAYQLWRDIDSRIGDNALIVRLGDQSPGTLERLRQHFSSVEKVPASLRASLRGVTAPPNGETARDSEPAQHETPTSHRTHAVPSPARAFSVYLGTNFLGR